MPGSALPPLQAGKRILLAGWRFTGNALSRRFVSVRCSRGATTTGNRHSALSVGSAAVSVPSNASG
jgi:hypothetical protein